MFVKNLIMVYSDQVLGTICKRRAEQSNCLEQADEHGVYI